MRPLTARQAAILNAKCHDGLTHKEVAARFGIAYSTAKSTMAIIYRNLGVRNGAQACSTMRKHEHDRVCADAAILRPEAV